MNFQQDRLNYIREYCQTIRNIGAGQDNYRAFFQGKDYQQIDIDPKVKPDILADAHDLPIADNSLDAIFAFSLLEHTHSPHIVVNEIRRVLRPGGYALISVPFIHPYHGGNCPDYYRFTKDGLGYLFREFSSVQIVPDGGVFLALQFFIPPRLEWLGFIARPTMRLLNRLFTQKRSTSHALVVFARK